MRGPLLSPQPRPGPGAGGRAAPAAAHPCCAAAPAPQALLEEPAEDGGEGVTFVKLASIGPGEFVGERSSPNECAPGRGRTQSERAPHQNPGTGFALPVSPALGALLSSKLDLRPPPARAFQLRHVELRCAASVRQVCAPPLRPAVPQPRCAAAGRIKPTHPTRLGRSVRAVTAVTAMAIKPGQMAWIMERDPIAQEEFRRLVATRNNQRFSALEARTSSIAASPPGGFSSRAAGQLAAGLPGQVTPRRG